MSSAVPSIDTCRTYDAEGIGGVRLLVDRLWPRGLSKAALRLDDWIKDVAPSDELRRWFGHDPERWQSFRKRYFVELKGKPHAVAQCLDWCANGPVTLLFAARDTEHNNAVVLRDYLINELKKERRADAR